MATSRATARPVKLQGFDMSTSSMFDHQQPATEADGPGSGNVDPSFLFGQPHSHALFGCGNSAMLFGHNGMGFADSDFEHAAFAPTTTTTTTTSTAVAPPPSNSVYDAFGFGKTDMFGLPPLSSTSPEQQLLASSMLTPHLQATSLAPSPFSPPTTTTTTSAHTPATATADPSSSASLVLPPVSVNAVATTAAQANAAAAAAFHQELQGLGLPSHNQFNVDSAPHMFTQFAPHGTGTDTASTTAATLAQLTAQANLESMFNSIMSPVDFARRNSTPTAAASKTNHLNTATTSSSASTPGASYGHGSSTVAGSGSSPSKAPPTASSSSSSAANRSKSLSQTRGRSTSLTRRKQSPPDSSSLTSASQERGRSNQRRSSSQVGKAPSSSARSRSARRNAAAYQSMGTGGAAAQASAAAAAAAAASSGTGSNLNGLPPGSPALGPLGVPSPVPTDDNNISNSSSAGGSQSHPIAMATIPSAPGSPSWYASSPQSTGLGTSAGTDHEFGASNNVDSGWKSNELASPFGPSSLKSLALEDVPEDDTRTAADVLTEKRRKRRESHNAVERRRRDNINERIQELATLLPEVLLEQACNAKDDDMPGSPGGVGGGQAPSAAHLLPLPPLGTSPQQIAAMTAHLTHGTGNQVMGTAGNKPNKGVILAKTVEYIRYLQQLVDLHTQRNVDLERMILELRAGATAQTIHPDYGNHHPISMHNGSNGVSATSSSASGGGTPNEGANEGANEHGTDAFMSFENFAAMSPTVVKEEHMEG
ncbi:hypothetical protein ACM66B_004311 [Microbotryomycetes sp. NB124-2]